VISISLEKFLWMYSIQTEYSIVSNTGMKYFALRVIQWARIVTHYGLDARGIEPWCGQDYPCVYRRALQPTKLPWQWVLGLFSRVKRPGHVFDPTSSSCEVKERVELYLYSSGPAVR
jgi:hypothetical protein